MGPVPRLPTPLIEMHSEIEEARNLIPEDELSGLVVNLNKVIMYSDILKTFTNYMRFMESGIDMCEDVKKAQWKLEALNEVLMNVVLVMKKLNESVKYIERWIDKNLDKLKDTCESCETYRKVLRASKLWNKWKSEELCKQIVEPERETVTKLAEKMLKCQEDSKDASLIGRIMALFQRDTHQRNGNANSAT